MLIDGQVHGGIVHAIGQALYEQVVYDDEGQLVTGTFVDYALPTAAEMPHMHTDRTETASPTNSLGVKGVGEAGTIAATPAVASAVLDALAPLGVTRARHALHAPARVRGDPGGEGAGNGGGPPRTEQGKDLPETGDGSAGSGPHGPGDATGGACMITAPFDYEAPESSSRPCGILAQHGDEAKLLAGGHSLLPLMKVRLAAPAMLVDLRRVPGLHGIQRENGSWRIGAMTRHADLQDRPELGVVARAASEIADQQVRNRGTIGGSLAHGDPASDLPAVVVALEGELSVHGPNGLRTIAAGDFFEDYLTTALAPDEVITEVRLPASDGYGFGYQKFTRRAEDWAMVGVCALVKKASDGSCEDVRIGLTNMGSTPLRASAVEGALRGGGLDSAAIARAADLADEGTEPAGDLNATADYKRHLARVLTKRALEAAAGS